MGAVRAHLAAATADDHARVDELARRFDCETAAGCTQLLLFLARGLRPLEERLWRDGAGTFYPPFAAQLRASSLPQIAVEPIQPFRGEAEVWGALYTLEGSRLGARMLGKRYAGLGDHPYFWRDRANLWREFLAALDAADARLGDRVAMVRGAQKAFAAFGRAEEVVLA